MKYPLPEELKVGCAKPAGGSVGKEPPKEEPLESTTKEKEMKKMIMIMLDRKAPDFIVPVYYRKFIIDPDAVIQGYEVLTPPAGKNVFETIRQIQAFQHLRKTKGTEATPSGWKPGKATLKPSPELEGKVWEFWKTK